MTSAEEDEDREPGIRFSLGRTIAIAAVLCAIMAAAWFVIGNVNLSRDRDSAVTSRDGAVDQKEQVLEATAPICERPQLDQELTLLCAQAEAVKRNPVATATAERVDYDRVQRMVDEALAQDPSLSEASLLALVQQVYTANPPKDGESPTAADLLGYIRQVYAENPPEPGPPGADGTNGTDGTDGRNAHCFDVPDDPACQPRQGVQGVSVVGFGFERTQDGQCVLAEVLENPASGERQTIRLPVPDQFCADPPAEDPPVDEEPGGLLPGG